MGYGLDVLGFESRQDEEIILFSKTSHRLYSPHSHTLKGYRNYFLGDKAVGA
jgi:hypothetical protein